MSGVERDWRGAFRAAALSVLWPPAGGHRRWGYAAAAGTGVLLVAAAAALVSADLRWWVTSHVWVVWMAAVVCAAVGVLRCALTGAVFAARIPYQPYMWRWYTAHVLAGALAVTAAVPMFATATLLWSAHSAAGDVFADEPAVAPIAVPDASTTTTTTLAPGTTSPDTTEPAPSTVIASTVVPTSAPAVLGSELADTDGRWNVLLLGGDAGPGRWGLRTDTLIVASVDVATGDAALISVPRNIERARFPQGPLADAWPDGFGNLINAVYGWAYARPELNPDLDDTARGAWATSQAVAQLTGLRIDDWVLVDMAAFVEGVDFLGGIDVWVPKRVPSPGNPPGAKHPVPRFFEPGWHHMDGTDALAYARSRSADSDYRRMERQRCVVAAIAEKASPKALAARVFTLPDLVSSSVRTSLALSELEAVTAVAGRVTPFEARVVSLAPPLITPGRPDYSVAWAAVAAVVAPPAAPAPTVSPTTAAPPTTVGHVPWHPPTTTTPPPPPATPPAQPPADAASPVLADGCTPPA